MPQAPAEFSFIEKSGFFFSLCSRVSLDVALYVAYCDGKNYGPLWHVPHTRVYSAHTLISSVLWLYFV